MFCATCGKEIPDGSAFCLHCGKPITGQVEAPPHVTKRRRWVLYLVALLAGVALIVVVVSRLNYEPPPTGSQAENPTPVLQPVSEKLFSGQSVVRAGKYVFVKFQVDPEKMHGPRVLGTFHASGGSGNDIQAVIAEESEFENWVNGHQARVLYSTDKLTNGKFDVSIIEAGTYYLAFSNTFSLLTDKDVFAEVELRYLAKR